MMGHSIGVTGHYSKPSALEIKTPYDQLFPKISVNGYVQARTDLKAEQQSLQSQEEKMKLLAEAFLRAIQEASKQKILFRRGEEDPFDALKRYLMTMEKEKQGKMA